MNDPPSQSSSRWSGVARRILKQIRYIARRFLLVTTVTVGVICGIIAVVFHYLIDLMTRLFIGPAIASKSPMHIVLTIVIPAATAYLLAMIINRWAPGTGGANLARVRLAYRRDPSLLSRRTILATFLLTPLSLGSGAPLGPESPTVVVASGVSVAVSKWLRLPKRIVRGMIPVGTAAGIAAIFNTPIAGVVFALEEILGTAQRGVLGGAIVASVAAAVVERNILGARPLVSAPSANWTDTRELIGFATVGIIAGAVSGGAIPLIRYTKKRLVALIPSWPIRVAIVGAMVGVIGLLSPEIFGPGYGQITSWLHGGGDLHDTSLIFATKTIAFIIALSGGMIGGTFAPSLFLGAALGAAVGHASALFLPGIGIEPGAFALVGMGAFFAGLLRNPIASVLIVLELTRDYGLILPLMLAIALSMAISKKIAPRNLVEYQMREEGFIEEEEDEADAMSQLPVWQVMTKDPLSVRPEMTLEGVVDLLGGVRHYFYPVVGEQRQLEGILLGATIAEYAREGRLEITVGECLIQAEYVANSDARLFDVLREMAEHDVRRCPVVAPDGSERLVGVLTPTDLLLARMKRVGSDSDEPAFSQFG